MSSVPEDYGPAVKRDGVLLRCSINDKPPIADCNFCRVRRLTRMRKRVQGTSDHGVPTRLEGRRTFWPALTQLTILEGMDSKAHWERVYQTKAPTSVSWYQPEARVSLDLIRRIAPDRSTSIIDVGGGASTLVDGLLEGGYRDVTVLDLAGSALTLAQARLGALAPQVNWIEANILDAELPAGKYGVWHDRAVFHFLTRPTDRARYVARTAHAVAPGGHVIVASFGPDGPARCSGLDVMRYSPESMHAEFGPGFSLLESVREEHHTPSGAVQAFVYCLCRMKE